MGDLAAEARAIGEATSPGSGHPKGWEPHVEEHGDTARAVSKPMDDSPTHDDLIRSWGMDPAEWAIVGDVQVRRWQTYDERWLRYFKANLTRRSRARQIDVEALSKRIARRTYPKPPASTGERWGRVICLNDWQLGKGEGGGSEATALFLRERFAMIDDLLRTERPPAVHILWVGDVTERVAGNYPAQAFTVDLDERQQRNLALDLGTEITDIAARRAPEVREGGVPCNHGENRNGAGKMHTRTSDNVTLFLLDTLERVFAGRPELTHVTFEPTPEGIANSTTVGGVPLTYTHGHTFPQGSGAMGKAQAWWTGQITGNLQPAREAQMLVYAHHHHFQMSEESGRVVMGLPASDGGSGWYTDRTGKRSPRGVTTFRVGLDIGDPMEGQRCWDDLRIL